VARLRPRRGGPDPTTPGSAAIRRRGPVVPPRRGVPDRPRADSSAIRSSSSRSTNRMRYGVVLIGPPGWCGWRKRPVGPLPCRTHLDCRAGPISTWWSPRGHIAFRVGGDRRRSPRRGAPQVAAGDVSIAGLDSTRHHAYEQYAGPDAARRASGYASPAPGARRPRGHRWRDAHAGRRCSTPLPRNVPLPHPERQRRVNRRSRRLCSRRGRGARRRRVRPIDPPTGLGTAARPVRPTTRSPSQPHQP